MPRFTSRNPIFQIRKKKTKALNYSSEPDWLKQHTYYCLTTLLFTQTVDNLNNLKFLVQAALVNIDSWQQAMFHPLGGSCFASATHPSSTYYVTGSYLSRRSQMNQIIEVRCIASLEYWLIHKFIHWLAS